MQCYFSVGRLYSKTEPKAHVIGKGKSLVLKFDLQKSNILGQCFTAEGLIWRGQTSASINTVALPLHWLL